MNAIDSTVSPTLTSLSAGSVSEGVDLAQPHVTIAATFTAEPIEDPLRFWLTTLGLSWDVQFAGYNQVFQQLLAPGSEFSANRGGYPVVLLRVEDFLRNEGVAPLAVGAAQAEELERVTSLLISALRDFSSNRSKPTLVVLLGASAHLSKDIQALVTRYERVLVDALPSIPHLVLITEADLKSYAVTNRADLEQDRLAHVPFTLEMYSALATAIARKLHMLEVPARKLLVLDCDNTLWGGIVGEDGPSALTLNDAHRALQQFAQTQFSQGVLIALCSKNSEADVDAAFEQHPEFLLQPAHVVAKRVNWLPKSMNILSLTRELNIGLDSVVFVDDNPVECAEVRTAHPSVLTLQFPQDPAAAKQLLDHLWVFDRVSITEEDRKRAELYRQNAARERFKEQSVTFGDFLAALELVIEIDPIAPDSVARVSQLTQRTNQFNTTTLRRGEAEVAALRGQGVECLCVRVRDRFGDYGLVGAMTFFVYGDVLEVDSMMLSCRVLGRGVEYAIIRHLGAIAATRGLHSVAIRAQRSKKNEPVMAFLEKVAGHLRADVADGSLYRFPTSVARGLEYAPGNVEEDDQANGAADQPISVRRWVDVSALYQRIAAELSSARAVTQAVERGRRRTRPVKTASVAPATEHESLLVEIWQQVLGLESIGVMDDFTELGGTSLLAARMFAELQRRTGVQLPLSSLLQQSTVRGLATRISENASTHTGPLVALTANPRAKRTFFFMHDGLGETLLYVNLAKRLPADMVAYGLEPKQVQGVPLAHRSIREMAEYYVRAIRSQQPHGPYYLGGLCAGGTIALEAAHQLSNLGERVPLVAMFDSAAPRAERRRGAVAKQRMGRLTSTFDELRTSRITVGMLLDVVDRASKKIAGAAGYEISSRISKQRDALLYRLLGFVLQRDLAWPEWLPAWHTQRLYDLAEGHYYPTFKCPAEQVVLFRATAGEGRDTPHRVTYEREDMGWGDWVAAFTAIDVLGGHSSMLQEPYVDDVASKMAAFLQPARDVKA